MQYERAKGYEYAFIAAIDAYRRGSIPIGCAIMNDQNECVATGQNSVYASDGREKINAHHLAHAEINAMLKVTEGWRTPLAVYTTLEPCIQCFGALTMGRYRDLHFAALDPFGGATAINGSTDYLKELDMRIEGPDSRLQIVQIALIVHRRLSLALSDNDYFLSIYRSFCQSGVDLAMGLFKRGELRRMLETETPSKMLFDSILSEASLENQA